MIFHLHLRQHGIMVVQPPQDYREVLRETCLDYLDDADQLELLSHDDFSHYRICEYYMIVGYSFLAYVCIKGKRLHNQIKRASKDGVDA
jgi:hypothetical protein